MKTVLRYGSLFSGLGLMDLGLTRAGWQCEWQVEINEFCRQVLDKHWPGLRRHCDVRSFPPEPVSEWRVPWIVGGFPCQDVSVAGPRTGIDGARSGLWIEFARVVDVLRPQGVIVENTPGLLDRGADRVFGDLARLGYDAEWSLVSSCSMGAPFVRSRLFIVAFPSGERSGQLRGIERAFQGTEVRSVRWKEAESGIPRELVGVPDRMERLVGLGNAVDPRVSEWIGRRIIETIGSGANQ